MSSARARRERLVAPRVPVDRVVGVLAQVRAGLAGEAVHTCRLRRARGGDGGRLCPAVVGLARRRAHDRVDEHDARAAPCSRARCARGVLGERVERRARRPARGCTTATTRSPQRSSGTPTTTASNTPACAFSTDSTSSGYTFSPPVLIDTEPRPSSVIVPSSSMRGVVAGHRPAHAVDHGERRRGLLRVLVVAERDVPAAGELADDAGAARARGRRRAPCVSSFTRKRGALGIVAARRPTTRLALPAGLRRAVAVDDEHAGQPLDAARASPTARGSRRRRARTRERARRRARGRRACRARRAAGGRTRRRRSRGSCACSRAMSCQSCERVEVAVGRR